MESAFFSALTSVGALFIFYIKKGVKHMNPFKSNNIVAKVLQVYAYLNAAAGIILAILLIKEWGAMMAAFVFALVLVINF